MTAALAIVRVTTRNVLGLRRLIGFGILTLFPAVIFILSSQNSSDETKLEIFSAMSLIVFTSVVVPIIAIVVSASVLGGERRGSTMSFLMLRPLSRHSIAAAKLVAAIAASFTITAVGAVALGTLGSIALGDTGYLTSLVAASLLTTAGYAAVYMPIGYLTERATLIGFIYIFVYESAIAGILLGLSGTSLWRIGASALAGLAPNLHPDAMSAALGSLTPGAGGAATKILVICAVSVVVTGWLLRTRDLT